MPDDLATDLGIAPDSDDAADTPPQDGTIGVASIPLDQPAPDPVPSAFAVKLDAKPDEVPEQFWNSKTSELRVGSLLKAFKDTQTELRNRQPQAPEQYEITLPEAAMAMVTTENPADDPLVAMALQWAKETGQSQDVLDKLFAGFGEVAAASRLTQEQQVEQLMNDLQVKYGSKDRANAVAQGVSNFINSVLPNEDGLREKAVAFAKDPEGFAIIEAFRAATKDRMIPTNATQTSPVTAHEEYQEFARRLAKGDTLTASERQRREELQGIIDRNGTLDHTQSFVATVPIGQT